MGHGEGSETEVDENYKSQTTMTKVSGFSVQVSASMLLFPDT